MVNRKVLFFALFSFFVLLASVQAAMKSEEMTAERFKQMSDAEKADFLNDAENPDLQVIDLKKMFLDNGEQQKIQKKIQVAVRDEENLWGDTVLEGDVSQTGDARADFVEVYQYRGTVYAYGISIIAPAVGTYLDGCHYNEETQNWEGDCPAGQISVYKLYTADFQEIDNGQYAEFEE
jgi:hypothetical protein